jgi:hypothetical protein
MAAARQQARWPCLHHVQRPGASTSLPAASTVANQGHKLPVCQHNPCVPDGLGNPQMPMIVEGGGATIEQRCLSRRCMAGRTFDAVTSSATVPGVTACECVGVWTSPCPHCRALRWCLGAEPPAAAAASLVHTVRRLRLSWDQSQAYRDYIQEGEEAAAEPNTTTCSKVNARVDRFGRGLAGPLPDHSAGFALRSCEQ